LDSIIQKSSRPAEGHRISEDGIRRLVDAFYAKVRRDPDLAPIFRIWRRCATSGPR
jgi:truncated hemoglobin YjbI